MSGSKGKKTAKSAVAYVPIASFGIQVGTFTAPLSTVTYPIWCDEHQRKHSNGPWPGSTPSDKPLFKKNIFDSQHLALPTLLATSVPWANFMTTIGGIDIIFDCGNSIVGTEGETYIWLQGGFQKDKIIFQAYPVEDSGNQAKMIKNSKTSGRYFLIDVSAIVG